MGGKGAGRPPPSGWLCHAGPPILDHDAILRAPTLRPLAAHLMMGGKDATIGWHERAPSEFALASRDRPPGAEGPTDLEVHFADERLGVPRVRFTPAGNRVRLRADRGRKSDSTSPLEFSPIRSEERAQQGIEVIEAQLDRQTAETWAEMLNDRYPTSDQWKEAKLSSVKAKLPDGATLPASRVPMTTDWWIALAVERDSDAVISVDDKGAEWQALRAVRRALFYGETLSWLET